MTDSNPSILSVQSSVAFGHVGNSAAVFPLQRLGIEVWPVNTVHFSNHTGYGSWRGPILSAGDVAEVIHGIEERGVFGRCDAVLSGYMGDVTLGEVILDSAERVRRANPAAIYCCDPVMGDVSTGFYVREGLPEFMRDRAVPAAHIATPNQFELEYLSGDRVGDIAGAVAAANKLRATGPRIVLVTSLRHEPQETSGIGMLAVAEEGAWLVRTPLLPIEVSGCGDASAALFLGHYLGRRDPAEALRRTASSIFAILEATAAAGGGEIALIAAQEAIVSPPETFPVVRVA